jgi:predicted dehydrogenase
MYKIALVGVGNIFRFHLEAYQAFPERCEIIALADIIPERCENAIAAHGLAKARGFSSHTEMLDALAGEIDLVSICTPPFCHAEIAIDCLKAGCNVIVEKPMAASLEECDKMLAAQRESGRILSPIAQNRFREPVQRLKAVLDSGLIGRVLHAQVDSHWWRGHCYYDLWWRGRWDKEGGGCTLNHAVHHIDMLLWMMGLPQKVTAVLSNTAHDNSEVEDLSIAVLQYAQGTLAQITSSTVHHGEEQQIIFQAEKARVSTPWKTVASISQENGFPIRNSQLEEQLDAHKVSLPGQAGLLEYEGHPAQIDDVLRALETGGLPAVTGEDGRAAIELITAIYKAGSEQAAVALPLTAADPFYTVDGILKGTPRFFQKSAALQTLSGDITTGSSYRYSY